jgi:hypothetical protein
MEAMASDNSRRLKAIRRLVIRRQRGRAEESLKQIAEIASGKGDLDAVFKNRQPDPVEPEPKRKRKAKSGHDRMETGGENRADESDAE